MNNIFLENIIFFYLLSHIDIATAFKGKYFTNPTL